MPTISSFFGLIIRMFFAPKEHNPPHIHVQYQSHKAIIDIVSNELTDGYLPPRQQRFVQAWVDIHKEDLLTNWELCQHGEEPVKIEPLK